MDEIGRKFREREILASNILMAAGKTEVEAIRGAASGEGRRRGKERRDDLKPYVNWNFTN